LLRGPLGLAGSMCRRYAGCCNERLNAG